MAERERERVRERG